MICVLCDFICLSMHCDDDDDDVDDEDEDEDERSILANWGKKYHCFFVVTFECVKRDSEVDKNMLEV